MRRLLFPLAVSLIIHFLIFSVDRKSPRNRYPEQKPESVTINLTYQQPPDAADEKRTAYVRKKKSPVRIDRPVVNPDQSGDSVHIEVPAASDITADIIPDHASQFSNIADIKKFPINAGENHEQAEKRPLSEAVSKTVTRIVKEAVPLYKENPAPEYPPQAKKRGYEGTVILDVLVTKEGKAGNVSVFQSSRYSSLDDAAVSSVKKWRFEPGEMGDKKVDMPVKIPIRFKLEED